MIFIFGLLLLILIVLLIILAFKPQRTRVQSSRVRRDLRRIKEKIIDEDEEE